MATRRILILAATLCAGLIFAAAAAASCNPGRPAYSGTYFDGWNDGPWNGSVCLNGSLADINNASPFVYSGAGETSDWTMVYNDKDGGYGQVGWDIFANGDRHNFVQTNDADTNWQYVDKEFGSSTLYSSPEYKVTYSANAFHYFVDGTNYYNPSSPTFSGCSVEQSGEIKNKDSQMPGNTNSHNTFSGPLVRRASDNTWFQANNFWHTFNDNTTWFGQAYNSGASLEIWDKYCSS